MGDINPKLKDKDLTEYKLPEKDSPFEDTAAARVERPGLFSMQVLSSMTSAGEILFRPDCRTLCPELS